VCKKSRDNTPRGGTHFVNSLVFFIHSFSHVWSRRHANATSLPTRIALCGNRRRTRVCVCTPSTRSPLPDEAHFRISRNVFTSRACDCKYARPMLFKPNMPYFLANTTFVRHIVHFARNHLPIVKTNYVFLYIII